MSRCQSSLTRPKVLYIRTALNFVSAPFSARYRARHGTWFHWRQLHGPGCRARYLAENGAPGPPPLLAAADILSLSHYFTLLYTLFLVSVPNTNVYIPEGRREYIIFI